MINKEQLRSLVHDVLIKMEKHSMSAENLILGTIAQESRAGHYLRQLGNGPARGIIQMEPATLRDLYNSYLSYRPQLTDSLIADFDIHGPDLLRLEGDLVYQIVMARLKYFRVPDPIPAHDDVKGLAWYWKTYWNTELGAGTTDEFIDNYHKYVT